jgi:hypothetical protein
VCRVARPVLGKKELRQLLKWREQMRKTWHDKGLGGQTAPEEAAASQSEDVCQGSCPRGLRV